MQEQQDKGALGVKKVPRANNFADILTHPPTAAEWAKILPCLGVYLVERSKGAFKLVETILRQRPELRAQVASSALGFLGAGSGWRRAR